MSKNIEPGLEPADDVADIGLPAAPAMDPADYLSEMIGFDMTEAEKIELLQIIWDIMRRFAETGVDIEPADPCGQIFGEAQEFSGDAPDRLESSFSKATERPSNNRRKRRRKATHE